MGPDFQVSGFRFLPGVNHRRRKRWGGGGGGGGGGAGGGVAAPNNFGGGNIPFGPPNNTPAFSSNFYVKQEKITNVSS